MTQPPIDPITALIDKNWYALAALVLMLLIQYAKTNNTKIWNLFPVGWRFFLPVLSAMAAAFTRAFLVGEALPQALTDSLNAIWQIAIPAMGGAAALKESHLPWDGGAGGEPPAPVPSPASPPELKLVSNEDDRLTPVDHSPFPPSSSPPPAA